MAKEDIVTGLVKRGAVYWIRVRIPSDVAASMGKSERCYSLKTRDRIVARQRVSIERLKIEAEFETVRRKGQQACNTSLPGSGEISFLGPEEIQRIVLGWFHDLELQNTEADRQLLQSPDGLVVSEKIDDLRVDETALREEIGPPHKNAHDSSWGKKVAEELLTKHGIAPDCPQFSLIRELVVRGIVESLRRRQARLTGNLHPPVDDRYFSEVFADAPLPAELTERPQFRMTVEQLAETFIAEQRPKGLRPKTLDTYRLVAVRLAEIVGRDTLISKLSRQDFIQFRDVLRRVPANATKRFPGMTLQQVATLAEAEGLEPMAARTVNKTFETLSALFNHAVECDWIQKNHARRIRVIEERLKTTRSLTIGQLQAIFKAPLYTGCKDDAHGYAKPGNVRPRRGRFWVPLIGLYSGMRLNEICQLYAEDIKTSDGVDFFDVRTALDNQKPAGDKRLKTRNSHRQVPIHPQLRNLGFIEYVEQSKRAGQLRLFPDLKLSSNGTYSDNFQKWFSRFLGQIHGANLADISFHWFRHTFRDALREAQVSAEVANRLCGWEESSGMAAHYGRGPSLNTLVKEISKVQYAGLNLEHLRQLVSADR